MDWISEAVFMALNPQPAQGDLGVSIVPKPAPHKKHPGYPNQQPAQREKS